MNYDEFLEHVINDGIDAVKQDYKPDDNRYEGSIKGFEDCRGKSLQDLSNLLFNAREKATDVFLRSNETPIEVGNYWYYESRALEIEWVCNSVSAMLINQGLKPIVTPTCRGVLNAARILGKRLETPG